MALGFCLSEESDLLSQWRGYAQDGAGFSVSFSVEKLKHIIDAADRGYRLALKTVSYGNRNWAELNGVIKQLHLAFGDDALKYQESGGLGSMSLKFTPEKHRMQKEAASNLFS
ncbi:MAG: DUF2971 domain-containing protein, partial [Phaeovulum sp.]